MTTYNVDSKGTTCPGPITDLIRAYRKASNGDIIILQATDPGVVPDSKAWCGMTKNELVDAKENNGEYEVTIKVTAKK